ncbi:MAG: DNA alkylation repair protein [Blastocatellia bacterium]|nr:DNA alkylation repair protein [Blastocatellia bacterium]
MPPRKKRPTDHQSQSPANSSIGDRVASALAWLREHATVHTLEGMARYGIPSDNALGVAVSDIKALGKQLGRSHELAAALWETGVYEARMLTSFVDEPERVTSAQMDRWCRDFDSWAIVDTLCFHLFDRTPLAWSKIEPWSEKRDEFGKRAAFALLACLALHDKQTDDDTYLDGLRLIELAAGDERNFVKKGVNWALRAVGERNAALNAAAVKVAGRLAESQDAAPRWIGKDALRQLASPAVQKRLSSPKRSGRSRS